MSDVAIHRAVGDVVSSLIVSGGKESLVDNSQESVTNPVPTSNMEDDDSDDESVRKRDACASDSEDDIKKPRRIAAILSSDGSDTESCDEDSEIQTATTEMQVGAETVTDNVENGIQESTKADDSDSDSVMSSDDEQTFKCKKALEQAAASSGDESPSHASSASLLADHGQSKRTNRSDVERMIRERNFSLPYHRAKKRSLDDFLTRRFSLKTGAPGADEDDVEKFYSSESSEDDAEYIPPTSQNDKTARLLEAVAEKLTPTEGAETPAFEVGFDGREPDCVADSGSRPFITARAESSTGAATPAIESSAGNENTVGNEVLVIPASDEQTESRASPSAPEADRGNDDELSKIDVTSPLVGENQKCPSADETAVKSAKLSRRERLLNILKDRLATTQPKLKATPTDVVDLESDDDTEVRRGSGVDGFINGFLQHMRSRTRKAKPVVATSLEPVSSEIAVVNVEEPEVIDVDCAVEETTELAPRAVLKRVLARRLRAAKVRSKVLSQAKEGDSPGKGENSDGSEDEEEEEEFDEDREDEYEDDDDDEEDEDIDVARERPRKKSAFVDDEAEDEDEGDADDESDEAHGEDESGPGETESHPILLSDSEEQESVLLARDQKVLPFEKKNLESFASSEDLFAGNSERQDCSESLASESAMSCNLANRYPSFGSPVSKVPSLDGTNGSKAQWRITEDGKLAFTAVATQDSQEKRPCPLKKLLGDSQGIDDDGMDLAALCSGTFGTQSQALESHPIQFSEETCPKSVLPEDVQDDRSSIMSKRTREESDEEDDDDIGPRNFTKKRRLRVESDDEDGDKNADGEVEDEELQEGSELENSDVEDDAGSVIYDSEENEIPVEEKDRYKQKLRNEFFDAEAELSGSDVGSGDEEENDSDAEALIDLLAPDEADGPSAAKIRNQIAALQARQQRDEDAREIRVLQEMLLADGDLHSDRQRERRFRWKNVDDEGADDVPIEDDNALSGDEDGAGISVRLPRPAEAAGPVLETETCIEWRTERLNREKWKNESLKVAGTELIVESHLSSEDSQITMSSKALQVIKKLSSMDENSSSAGGSARDENEAPAFKINRKSFLSHSEDDLKRLADLTKSAAIPEAPTHQAVSKRSNNFVFAHVTPGQPGLKKRQELKTKLNEEKRPARVDRSFQKLADDQKQTSIFKFFS